MGAAATATASAAFDGAPAPAASPSFIASISWARMSTLRSISASRASVAALVEAALIWASSERVSARSFSRRCKRSSGVRAAGVGVGDGAGV